MSAEEKKPILDSGIYIRPSSSYNHDDSVHQQLVIQPVEFDHKHRNWYGYLAFVAFVLVLINYLMIKERTCQITFDGSLFKNYNLMQSFHMTVLVVTIIIFVLSYFNFAMVIYEFKLLFYVTALLIFVCAGLLIYNTVAIFNLPCVPLGSQGVASLIDTSGLLNHQNDVFSAGDGVGITVFFFNIISACLLFFTGRSFYRRS